MTGIWTAIPSSPSPGTTFNLLAFDTNTSRTLAFGGVDVTTTQITQTNTLWAWDGATWTQLCTSPSCSGGAPTVRAGHAMTFDSIRSRLVVFGGETFAGNQVTANFTDTWEWDGSYWSRMCANGACSTVSMNATFGAMAFDSDRGKAVLFGGSTCESAACTMEYAQFGTWEWDGSKWDVVCGIKGSSCTAVPPPRNNPGMVYDSKRRRSVLFGGSWNGTRLGDTWEWNGTAWQQMCTSAPCVSETPTARSYPAMAFDGARGKTVLFGGCSASGCTSSFTDTWEWDGSSWVQTAETPALATGSLAMAFDSARSRVVLYENATGIPSNTLTTWEYHVHGETCAADKDCDTGHCVDGVCCESVCTRPCSVCNLPKTAGTCAPTPGCAGVCDGNTTITDPEGNQFSCAPYKCTTSASCTSSCVTTADCIPPTVCNSAGKCVPAPPAATSSGGGCVTGGGDGDMSPIAFAVLASGALGAVARRRWRRGSPRRARQNS